jgi:8-oxo-dGTP pyrophosphatase MutT (NUDIX family)
MTNVVVGIIEKEVDSTKKFLLVSSKKDFGKYTGFYYPPGGHLEEGEDDRSALIREIKEELGIQVDPTDKLASTDSDIEGQITHWWKCDIHGEINANTDEIEDYGYYSLDEMEEMNIFPSTRKFFENYVK